jgi:hypothetical protein
MKKEQQKQLQELFSSLPEENNRRIAAADQLLQAFRKEAAAYLLPAFQDALRAPPENYLEKQNLAFRLNTLLHHFGLGLRHPEMKEVCGVNAAHSTTYPDGWLRLGQRKRSALGHYVRSASSNHLDLEQLKLVEAPSELPGPNLLRHQ